jgi:hypothetical protein
MEPNNEQPAEQQQQKPQQQQPKPGLFSDITGKAWVLIVLAYFLGYYMGR